MRKQKAQMKYIAAIALMLNLGVASVYAQQHPVKMVFSGTDCAYHGQSTAAQHN